MKILNPIVTPVSSERSPSGQMRVKSNGGGKLLAIKRCHFDEQAAAQIVRALNGLPELIAALEECVTDSGAHCYRSGTAEAFDARLTAINTIVSNVLAKART